MNRRLPARLRAFLALVALIALLLVGCGGGPAQRPGAGARTRSETRRPPEPPLLPVRRPVPRTVRLPVLTYHRVHRYASERAPSVPDLTVEPTTFEEEIAGLRRRGYHSVTDRQVYDALFKGRPLPPKPVMLTFDDGYRDAVTDILPVLERYGMVGTFYIITDRVGGRDYVTVGDLRRLAAAGMDIGGHSATHPDLTTVSARQLERETSGSRRRLERMLGRPVPFFAYPFGRHDARVVAAVRRAGFAVAFTTQAGTRLASTSALTEPRLHIGRQTTAEGVLSLVEAGR